ATETPMLPAFMGKKSVDAEGLARFEATVPLGRLNQPDDLARTAVFLASDDAAMITGTCVEVDGGRCIWRFSLRGWREGPSSGCGRASVIHDDSCVERAPRIGI